MVSSSVRTAEDVSQHIMCVMVTMTVEITPMNSTVHTVNFDCSDYTCIYIHKPVWLASILAMLMIMAY